MTDTVESADTLFEQVGFERQDHVTRLRQPGVRHQHVQLEGAVEVDVAVGAVDRDGLAGLDPLGAVDRADDAGDVKLAGDDRTVRHDAADVGDDGDGDREQGETGIYGVRVTLTGVDSHGRPLELELLLEAADENPFLKGFYRNRRRGALPTQLFFLLQRARQIEVLNQADMFQPVWISDFLMEKDRLFAELAHSLGMDVVAEGGFIAKGSRVRVTRVDGNRIVVDTA